MLKINKYRIKFQYNLFQNFWSFERIRFKFRELYIYNKLYLEIDFKSKNLQPHLNAIF